MYESPVEIAVKNGDLEQVKYLLSEGGWVFHHSEALLQACISGNLEIVKYLIEEEGFTNINSLLQGGPLRYASTFGHLHILQYLVSKGGNLHDPNNDIVHPAAKNGHLHIIKYFIEQKVNIRKENDYPLTMACYKGHLEIVKLLVENGSDVNGGDGTLLRWACEGGNMNIVKYLIEKNTNISDVAFNAAIVRGDLEMIEYIYKKAKCPLKLILAHYNLSLRLACLYGDFEVVKFLVDHGAKVNAYNGEPLQNAFEIGNLPIAKYLVEKGARFHDYMNLNYTVKNNFHHMITYLLQTNEYKNFGNLVTLACQNDKFDIIRVILSKENVYEQYKHVLQKHQMKQFDFYKKMRRKKEIWAVNTIGTWWIPFCYDLKRESGQRMMERSWKRVEEMYEKMV